MLLLHTVKFKVKTYQQSSWSALNLHLRKKPKVFHLCVDDSRAENAPLFFCDREVSVADIYDAVYVPDIFALV